MTVGKSLQNFPTVFFCAYNDWPWAHESNPYNPTLMKINDQKKLYRENIISQTDILMLPESRGWDATVVGGQCAKSIRRIHLAINRLATMGDDELRTLWVEVRGKRLEWYRLSTSVYEDIHYFYVTGDSYDHHIVCDKDNGNYN